MYIEKLSDEVTLALIIYIYREVFRNVTQAPISYIYREVFRNVTQALIIHIYREVFRNVTQALIIHIYREVFSNVKQALMASVLASQYPELSKHILSFPSYTSWLLRVFASVLNLCRPMQLWSPAGVFYKVSTPSGARSPFTLLVHSLAALDSFIGFHSVPSIATLRDFIGLQPLVTDSAAIPSDPNWDQSLVEGSYFHLKLSIVAMALLWDLPDELFVMIVGALVARRINHFDPIAIKDLQSLRLVCQKVGQVGSPL